MQIPKTVKLVDPDVFLERRRWYDEAKRDFFKKLEALSSAGYQPELLQTFRDDLNRFLEHSDSISFTEEGDGLISLVPVIPRNFRSGFDQMSSLGSVCGRKKGRFLVDPSVVKETEKTPVKPYCLYGVDFGLDGVGDSPGVSSRKAKSAGRLCLTEVEVICLAVIHPWLSQYFVCAAGIGLNQDSLACLQFDEDGAPVMLPVGSQFRGILPNFRKVITPTCSSRSI